MNKDKFKAKNQVVETFTDQTLDALARGPFSAVVVAVVLVGMIAFGIWVS